MKTLKSTLTILIVLLTFKSAHAAIPFCEDPLKYTCANSEESAQTRADKIEKIQNQLKTEAFNKMLTMIDPDIKDQLSSFDDIDTLRPKKVKLNVEKIFYAQLRIAFGNYLTRNHLPVNSGNELIVESLHLAIDQSPEVDAATKAQMHAILNDTRIITFHNNVDDNSLDDVHALYKSCDKYFEDNAFATTLHKQKVVIICPGEVIGSIEFSNESNFAVNQKLMPLVATLGHELSHHFDYRYFPGAYTDLLNELQSHQSELKKPAMKYMSESSADMWGLKTAKILMEKIGSPVLRSQMYMGALNDLCDSEDDGVHPSDEFRINVLANQVLCQ